MTNDLISWRETTDRLEKLCTYAWKIEGLCKNYKINTDNGWVGLTLQERKERIRTLMLRMYEELEEKE